MGIWLESWSEGAPSGDRRGDTLVRFMPSLLLDHPSYEDRARALLEPPHGGHAPASLPPQGALRDYVAAHVLARLMLAEAAGCDPGSIVFGATPLGRPRVLGPASAARFGISLAHADGIAVCGIANGCDIGVDVASLRAVGSDPLGAADALFSRGDRDSLRALEPGLRPGRFLMLRTRMEAVAKARGAAYACTAGILATDAGTAWRPPSPPGEPRLDATEGRVESWRLTPAHVAAVAILGAPQRSIGIRLEEVAAESPAVPAPRPASWSSL